MLSVMRTRNGGHAPADSRWSGKISGYCCFQRCDKARPQCREARQPPTASGVQVRRRAFKRRSPPARGPTSIAHVAARLVVRAALSRPRLTMPSILPIVRDRDKRTVIMGAGPGGLCSAYVLTKAVLPAIVVEKAPFVGGLARTIRRTTAVGEFKFDIGGHRWFTKNDELNDLFREVVGDELLWVDRTSRIYFDGCYVDYPLKISNALTAIGPFTAARAMADYLRTRVEHRLAPRPIQSMEDAYVDQFGPTLYRLFFQRYSEKVWGLPCREMSGDWVTQRSKGMSIVTAVKDAIVPSRGKVISLIDRFMYPRNGFGRLSERMADAIATGGNSVRLNAGIARVHRAGHRITSVTVESGDGTRARIEADAFVSSIPLTMLAQIMDPPPPPDVIEAARA